MTKRTRVWLIIAAALIVAGIICCGISFYLAKGDYSLFSTEEFQTMEYELKGDYVALTITTDTADIVFHPSPDGKTRVICRENVKRPHSVCVEDDFLKISVQDLTKWHDHISIGDFYEQEIIDIYLPRATYNALYIEGATSDVSIPKGFAFWTTDIALSTGDVYCSANPGNADISTDTGDITLENTKSGMFELETSTGLISLTDISCHSLKIEGGSGDVSLRNVCTEISLEPDFVVETDTGDVHLISCDGDSIEIETDSGDVRGSFLTEKRVFAESDTGNIDIPPLPDEFGMGFCKVKTDSGDICIEIEN